MSKKLIAVASASALALSLLVGVAPASATPTITYNTGSGTGTLVDPYVVAVPEANSIVASTNALHIDVTSIAAGDTATVSVTSGTAKVATAPHAQSLLVDATTLGSSSKTVTLGVGDTDANFYVYQTSTAAASVISISVTKTASGTTSTTTATKYLKPSIGAAHFVTNLTAPATMTPGVDTEVTFNVTDVFGNVLDTANINTALATSAGTLVGSGNASYDTVRKIHITKVAAASTSPFILTVNAASSEVTGVGFAASTLRGQTRIVNNPATATANAAATAQIAALTAQLADSRSKAKSVTKKKYNTLARKWNAAFPSQKVALKK